MMCLSCRLRVRQSARERNRQLREHLLRRYGNACRCCGIRQFEFLTLDHVYNDGHIERKMIPSPLTLYRKILERRGKDRRYQLLCWNCNLAKAKYGLCPHQASGRARGPALKAPGRQPATVA